MARYAVHAFCDECGQTHPMGPINLRLDDGPVDRASIGDTYAGRQLPNNVANIIRNQFTCTTNNTLTIQEDNAQIFLVPLGD